MERIKNGKSIYQLTSADALKDTDLFVISSADNLTRSITLNQLKTAVTKDYLNKEEATELLDDIRTQIGLLFSSLANSDDNTIDFKNYFNTQLHNLEYNFNQEFSNFRLEIRNRLNSFENEVNNKLVEVDQNLSNLTDSINTSINGINDSISNLSADTDNKFNAIDQDIANLNSKVDRNVETLTTSITNTNTTLSQRITDLDNRLTDQINSLFSYGTEVPTTLATGKFYFQYF